jgi:hypothetical protein
MMRKALFVVVALLIAGPAFSQTVGIRSGQQASALPANQVYVGQAFSVVGNHDGWVTNEYTVQITGPTGYTATLPVTALAGGEIVFPVPSGLSQVGNYSVIITATGDGGSTPSDPFVFDVVAVPAAPAKVTNTSIRK